MATALLAGCAKDGLNEEGNGYNPSAEDQILFVGGFSDNASTRTAFEEAVDGKYQLVWTRGDAIGIFTWQGSTANINQRATLLRTSDGQAQGVFLPDEPVAGEGEEAPALLELPESGSDEFLIYYPYADGTDINVDDVKIHSSIAELQSQDAASNKQIGRNGFSYGMATVNSADKKINFTLKHTMAYVRFVVSSTEFADYGVRSIQLVDRSGKAALSGDFTFDPETGTVAPVEGKTNPAAKISVEGTAFAALGGSTAELYLTVLPGDLSNSDLYAIVTFEDKDGASVTIPMALSKKGNLPAGSMTTIELSNVSAQDNAFAWYQPIEKRKLVDGWCYGSQNTFLVARSATEGKFTEFTFDVKARGDFSMVKEPKYYGIISSGDTGNNGLVCMPDGSASYVSVPEVSVNADYTVTVKVAPQSKNCGSSAYGVIAIYDADYNIIWSFMIWSYYEGDEPGDVEYPSTGYTLLDRNVGAKYSATHDMILQGGCTGAVFQWGRPTPFMYSNSNQTHYDKVAVTPETDLATVIAHPYWMYAGVSGTTPEGEAYSPAGDWKMDNHRNDMWGAVNKSANWYDPQVEGEKTIYDPCPEGYRVASGNLLNIVLSRGERNESNHTDITPADQVEFEKTSVLRYSIGAGVYDYWIYNFAHWGSSASWGNRAAGNSGYLYWANCTSVDPNRASILQGCYMSSGWSTANDAIRSHGFSVRCMKDEKGR